MKIVHSWLRDLAPLPDDVDRIAATLSDLGLAVDGVATVGATVDGVITARVLRTERHPDAAKVHRVFVDAGDGVAEGGIGLGSAGGGEGVLRAGAELTAHGLVAVGRLGVGEDALLLALDVCHGKQG